MTTQTIESTQSGLRHSGPIRFEVYREGVRATDYVAVGTTAMGPESVPIPGDVFFDNGLLIINRKDDHACGLSLLWDCAALGVYQLETTRLPPREKPYNLNVELARFRLMKIMQKQEDWNLFDFPKADKFSVRVSKAQNLFADALGKLHEPEQASLLADRALAVGIELSEQLASFHGEQLISRRKASNGFVKHIFGCRVEPAVQNEKYKEAMAGNFDYCVLPMSWKQLQPQENMFATGALDEWVEVLSRKRIPTIAGPLIRLDESGVPDWMVIWEHDFDMLREMTYDFVQKVVTRYRRAVAAWNVVGGMETNAAFSLTFEQMIELTRLLVSQVKTLLPNARTMITITHPFGEYHARSKLSVQPMLYAEMVAQAGISFEAFALEIEMGVPEPGHFTRDLFQLSSMLDKFSTLGRPVFITAVGVPGRSSPDAAGASDPSLGGRWHRPWDPQLQADWMEAVYHVAFSKPFVESIAWANLADLQPSLPGGGLLDDTLRPKPSFQKLQQMREVPGVSKEVIIFLRGVETTQGAGSLGLFDNRASSRVISARTRDCENRSTSPLELVPWVRAQGDPAPNFPCIRGDRGSSVVRILCDNRVAVVVRRSPAELVPLVFTVKFYGETRMPEDPPGNPFPWTASQGRGLLILLSVFFLCLCGRYACNRSFIDNPQPDISARADELADRLDPNIASWQEISAIPSVGEKKAKALVAFRENWMRNHANSLPFREPQDLKKVKGIGPATVANMRPYLIFPAVETRPATRP